MIWIINDYNIAFTELNDYGIKLYVDRERSIDLIDNIEHLINSIANKPKTFDSDMSEIKMHKQAFLNVCDFAKNELDYAKKSVTGAGAGIAAGTAVASLAPSAAIWIATTFGTASTGTAISALSGAAATNAALAWLGGGALAAGGGGVVAGNALLALAGPIGWEIAGATLLTSIILFTRKKSKNNSMKRDEIEKIKINTEAVKESAAKIKVIYDETSLLRDKLSNQYILCSSLNGKSFMITDNVCAIIYIK